MISSISFRTAAALTALVLLSAPAHAMGTGSVPILVFPDFVGANGMVSTKGCVSEDTGCKVAG